MRIALIEPDLRHAKLVGQLIFAGGHLCQHFTASAPFLEQAADEFFDLLITENWAGDQNAEDLIPRARAILPSLPVIVLMPSPRESQIVAALNAGADDCLTKPVRGPEMLARVEALLRRAGLRRPLNRRHDVISGYTFDSAQFAVTFRNRTVLLTPKEFRLALLLFNNLSRPVSRAQILDSIWTRGRGVTSRTVDTHASRVRSKLELHPEHGYCLTPLYGYGYQLDAMPREAVVEAG
jgi:two-component system, OmpR family, response regulator